MNNIVDLVKDILGACGFRLEDAYQKIGVSRFLIFKSLSDKCTTKKHKEIRKKVLCFAFDVSNENITSKISEIKKEINKLK